MSTASVALSPVFDEPCCVGPREMQLDESILIYLTVGGTSTLMQVFGSDSIASVKLRIQRYNGFFVKKHRLVYEGKELARNNSLVRDYGVTDGNVLHLVLKVSDIQAITVQTVCGKLFEFNVDRKRNVGYVKKKIATELEGLFDLKDQELICDGEELEDQTAIDDICRTNGDAVLHLLVRRSAKVRAKPVEKDFEVSIIALENANDMVVPAKSLEKVVVLKPLTIHPEIPLTSEIKELIKATLEGLNMGKEPIRSLEGSGGAYFMQDSYGQRYVSVFKPNDEEPMAGNNPRGLPLSTNGEGLKKGTRVGEGAVREVAAYILDHPRAGPRSVYVNEKGFAGVPPTVMVECLHDGFNYLDDEYGYSCKKAKIGSLQFFVENSGSSEEMGPGVFPVEDVHKISVLDIRLANTDRHAGNILVVHNKDNGKGEITLVPIDHGYCLPESLEDCTFDWLYWPQAKQPYSPETINYINMLDAEVDIELLKFHGWKLPEECARILRISTMLLKKGAAERGLTAFDIGSMMCRETIKKKSVIELIVEEAQESLLPHTSEAAFLDCVSSIMDRYLDEVSQSYR
ncbi:unnamed protein product [Cuscuta europaea]|uniref:1-phosphatidylinositol 4-kinase n=1 Tax=Cuscuta europaea TaxID=41803 RepID=A0A9P0YNX1_CUSEU|nr:unnamed protein product [Cuscuta europaea]